MADLEKEIETYNTKLSSWAAREGQFVLIHQDTVVGFYHAYDQALRVGYEQFGIEPFLVKQVMQTERSHFVSRLVAPHVS